MMLRIDRVVCFVPTCPWYHIAILISLPTLSRYEKSKTKLGKVLRTNPNTSISTDDVDQMYSYRYYRIYCDPARE